MALAIPDRALRLVTAQFDPATVGRAVGHARAERVQVIKPPPWPVVARVRDGDTHVVTVHLQRGSEQLRGECSCPVAADCEHAIATALVVLAQERTYAAARAEAARQDRVGEWLAELGRDQRPPVPAADRAVGYLLDEREGELGITVHQCTRLREGGLGTGSAIGALADPHRGAPRWVEIDDLRWIAMLRAVSRAPPDRTRLGVERVPAELLRELAGSGRLFWATTRSAPLTWGPPRRAALRWLPCTDAPGCHRLGVDPELVIVPAAATCYLDPDDAVLGALELGVAAPLVQRLIAGPPVPATMRATVARSLRPLLALDHLHDHDEDEDEATTAMRPRMYASVEPDGAGTPAIHVVAEADYGGDRYPLAGWDAARPLVRDLVAEGRYRDRLQALLAGLPSGGRSASSLALLADARHLAEVIVPALRAEGWTCELADSFPCEAPVAEVAWVEQLRPLADGRAWFAVELGVSIAGRTVPLLPILLRAIQAGELVLALDGSAATIGAGLNVRLPDGELVHVTADRLRRWLRPLVELELRGLDAAGALVVPAGVATAIDDDAPGDYAAPGVLAAARDHLAALVDLAPRREGRGFGGVLRPYQRLGLAWLRRLHDADAGGVLADEMGLGKTVQVLAFLDGLRTARALAAPALVVAPRSVVGNWAREAARFTPRLAATVHLGPDRAGDAAALTRAPLIVTSYQTLLRDLALFRTVRWTTVVFDEAQALKNPDTQLRAAAASLRAGSRFAITGTPIENHLGELWSQLDLVMPGLLGRRAAFDAVFRRAIERGGDIEPLARVRQRVRPFLLRRTKDVVAPELPPRTEIVERIDLEPAQRDLYESLRLRLDQRVQEALVARGVGGASMAILHALLVLRQCCCDPRLVRLAEARRVSASAKLDRLLDMLVELADSGRRTLVFSQFTSMLALIEAACAGAGLPTLTLTGATRDRDDVVRRFQDGAAPVFLISLKAGGVGLNLTAADTVIHYDPWWNPAVEAQAADRAHRIGQTRPLTIYKLVAAGTLEETICELQADKRGLAEATLRDGGVSHLAADDLAALYRQLW